MVLNLFIFMKNSCILYLKNSSLFSTNEHIFYFFIEKVKLEKKKKTSMIKNNLG
jgi:hypothetical protein